MYFKHIAYSSENYTKALLDGWTDGWMTCAILRPFKQYFSHIRTMGG